MEIFKLQKDIKLLCLKADSFPDGIKAAHEKLVSIKKPDGKHNYHGVSYSHDDEILYMAGVDVSGTNERIPQGCETYTLRKGNYISIYINDFAEDVTQIDKAFKKLLSDPRIDENGCCAEFYLPEGSDAGTAKHVRCAVRIADKYN